MFIKGLALIFFCCNGASSTSAESITSEEKPSGFFDYNPYSKFGPERWYVLFDCYFKLIYSHHTMKISMKLYRDNIKIRKSEYFDFTKVKKNQCDGKKQSPINIRKTKSCQDDHRTYMKVSNLCTPIDEKKN